MTTQAQIRDYRRASEALRQHAPRGALKVLTDDQLATLLCDWLTQDVGIDPTRLEALGNYFTRQAWMAERDKT